MAPLKRRPCRRGEGVPDGTAGEAAAPDLRHQTLAVWPETRRGSAEPGGGAAAALAKLGSTTGQQRWPGAEGGQRPALFTGYGHHGAAAEIVNRQDVGSDCRKTRSTVTGKGRSAGGAFALPVSPKGKRFLRLPRWYTPGHRFSIRPVLRCHLRFPAHNASWPCSAGH